MSIFTGRPQIIATFTGNPATGQGIQVPALTNWFGRPFSTSIDNVTFNVPMPLGGSLYNMIVRTSTPQPGDGSLSISLLINNAASVPFVSVVIPTGSPLGSYFDLINAPSLNPGDLVRYSILNNSPTLPSAGISGIYMLLK